MYIHDFLIENGYEGPIKEQYKDYCVYYHRSVPNARHQWIVREYDLSLLRKDLPTSYEVAMCYECADGTWVESKFYSINGEDLKSRLYNLENRLYNSIEAMGGNKNHYQGNKEQ